MPTKYYLIDTTHNKLGIYKHHINEVASRIALKYGAMGRHLVKVTQDMIEKLWSYDKNIPTPRILRRYSSVAKIKWFIHNVIQIEPLELWNNNFLHGMVTNGVVKYNEHRFPSFLYGNPALTEIIKSCPFGGKIVRRSNQSTKKWSLVPALCLSYSDKTISFMAGVLSGGEVCNINNHTYVAYRGQRAIDYLKQWRIPIEIDDGKRVFISPVWPALFVNHMPPECRNNWLNLRRPFRYNIYTVILWHTYINKNWPKNGIPYLPSKRCVIYQNGGRGAIDKIERMRVELNLVELDGRIKDVVQEWGKNVVSSDKSEK